MFHSVPGVPREKMERFAGCIIALAGVVTNKLGVNNFRSYK